MSSITDDPTVTSLYESIQSEDWPEYLVVSTEKGPVGVYGLEGDLLLCVTTDGMTTGEKAIEELEQQVADESYQFDFVTAENLEGELFEDA